MTPVEAAQAALDAWHAAHQLESIDPGMQSMRFHQTERQRGKSMTAFLNRMRREAQEVEHLEARLAKAKREERIAALPKDPIDPATIHPGDRIAELVRGSWLMWHTAKRVNAKTVTCHASEPGMDEPRIPHQRIVAIRPQEANQ